MNSIRKQGVAALFVSSLVLSASPAAALDGADPCPAPSPRNTQILDRAAHRDEGMAAVLESMIQSCRDDALAQSCRDAKDACRSWLDEDALIPHQHAEDHLRSQMATPWLGERFVIDATLPAEAAHPQTSCDLPEGWQTAAVERRRAAARHRQVIAEYARFTRWAQALRAHCQGKAGVAQSPKPTAPAQDVRAASGTQGNSGVVPAGTTSAAQALENEARAREAERREREAREAESRAREEAQRAQARAQQEQQQRAQAEARAQQEQQERAQAEARAQQEQQRRADAEARARQEQARRSGEVRDAEYRAEQERRRREEEARQADERAREEAERRDREVKDAMAAAAQERSARAREVEEAERRARAERETRQREVDRAEQLAREEKERRAREVQAAERRAREENEARQREAKRKEQERLRQERDRAAKAQLEREVKEAEAQAKDRREKAQREELERRAEFERRERARAEEAAARARQARAELARERAEAVERYEASRARLVSESGEQSGQQKLAELAQAHQARLTDLDQREGAIVARERQDAFDASNRLAAEKDRRRLAEKEIAAAGAFRHPRARSNGSVALTFGVGNASGPSEPLGGFTLSARHAAWFTPPAEGFGSGVELSASVQGWDPALAGALAPAGATSSGRHLLQAAGELRLWLSRFAVGASADFRSLDTDGRGGVGFGPSLAVALVDSFESRVIVGARWLPLLNGGAKVASAEAEFAWSYLVATLQAGTVPRPLAPADVDVFVGGAVGLRYPW